jgi:hypothetical protein
VAIGESNLNIDQQKAVRACAEIVRERGWARLEGPAGTGKTYTAGNVLPAIPIHPRDVLGVTLSHTAAKQLRSKKNIKFAVTTIAAAMFKHIDVPTSQSEMAMAALEKAVVRGEVERDSERYCELFEDAEALMDDAFVLNPEGRAAQLEEHQMLVIDEHSMVPPEVLPYLRQHLKCPLLLLGDSFQLPPPGYREGAFVDVPITHELTTIMRGLGTNIPDIAMRFRKGTPRFMDGRYGDFGAHTLQAPDREFRLRPEAWKKVGEQSDIVLAPHHRTRQHITKNVRHAVYGCGLERPVMPGDRFLVKSRNDFGLEKSTLMVVGKHLAIPEQDERLDGYLRLDIIDQELLEEFWLRRRKKELVSGLKPDRFEPEPLYFPTTMLEWAYQPGARRHGYDRALSFARSKVGRFRRKYGGLVTDERGMVAVLEYGWAVTVHSVQGGEYDRVFLFYPGWGALPTGYEARRLVYTGITRAKRTCWLLRTSGCFD